MVPFLTPSREPAVCEEPSKPCCRFTSRCDGSGLPGSGKCRNGDAFYGRAGESVSNTRSIIDEPVESIAVLVTAGATDTPWPIFISHAVGMQVCSAKGVTNLDEDFWAWLEARPDLLLSLAATAYPVQGRIWENLEKLWKEFRSDAESNPDLGSHLIGFAYMQRKTSVDVNPVSMQTNTAHGDGDVKSGHSEWYGHGKVPVHGTNCKGGTSDFPERDEHPTAIEVVRYHIEQSKDASKRDVDPVGYPWPLVPHGYYAPLKECDWVVKNRGAKCPYTMRLFDWLNDKTPASSNPFCKRSSWHPLSLPRISEDGRVCGGCSYHSFAKSSCLGKVAGRRPEPGHSGDFIFTSSGTGKTRSFSVSSPWAVTGGYKMINGNNAFPLTIIDTFTELAESETWQGQKGIWHDLLGLAQGVGNGNMPKFDSSRIAGMLAEHTYWYTDDDTRKTLLTPLAQRALRLNPNDGHLWRLLFKLNSKRTTYAGRNREAEQAFKGMIFESASFSKSSANFAQVLQTYLERDPADLAEAYKRCRQQGGKKQKRLGEGLLRLWAGVVLRRQPIAERGLNEW